MIRKSFLVRMFDLANMRRWNDKICPVELRELDKQAHKMTIAYLLGKFEEEKEGFDWLKIIEGGIFEFLQRLMVTDLKPQIFHKIKEQKEKYKQLNEWVIERLSPVISSLGVGFLERFKDYLLSDEKDLNKRIVEAAHFYATKWEFEIIKQINPNGYEINEIKNRLQVEEEKFYDLKGFVNLKLHSDLRDFIDLCGELRFQIRWSHLNRVPRTSVLGQMLIVAILSYLFSLEINACKKRCVNNYFTGLFHDLPEVLTRDIIDPVKKSVATLDSLIKEYEKEEMEKRLYPLIPKEWHSEIKMFTEDEFSNIVVVNGKTEKKSSEEISASLNKDTYNPRDGEIVKAADHLTAFLEAYLAITNGSASQELVEAKSFLRGKYANKSISDINFGAIYADFE